MVTRRVPILGIIFDMDGVIINTVELHKDSWIQISKIFGYPWNENVNFMNDVFGTCSIDSARILFGNLVDKDDINYICQKKTEIFYELLQKEVQNLIVPGFLEFFNSISLDIPVALATSSTFEEASYVLKSIGIYNRFDVISCISDAQKPKPDPEIYLKTCNKLGLSPNSCIGFEDSISGINALLRAGISCIAVGTTLSFEKIKSHGLLVSHYIKNFNELISVNLREVN